MSFLNQLDEGESFTPWMDLPEKIAIRRLKVRSLARKGYTKAHIARITKVSKMTVSRDIQFFIDNNINFMNNFNPQLRISESIMLYKEIEDEAMKSMYECEDSDKGKKSKIGFMRTAIDARKTSDNLLSEIGAFKIKIESNEVDISKMNEDELDQFLEDSEKMIKKLEEDIQEIEAPSDMKEMSRGWRDGLVGK